ncbi:hypothetical protein SRHO_G00204420 [Serrasalmus rhombeus]
MSRYISGRKCSLLLDRGMGHIHRHPYPTRYPLDGIDNRLGDLANSVTVIENKLADIKGDVTANRKCIEEAEARILVVEEKLDKTESALASATKRLVYLEAKMDDLENRARRKNIRVFGLKEGAEGSRPFLDFVHDMLPKWLDLGFDRSFILERVHRTLAPARPNHNQAVLIRFLKFQDKEFVLRTTRQRDITYDGTKLSFAQDLSAETIRRRCEFDGVKKFFIDMGTFPGFHHHPCKLRVLHREKIQLFSSPQEAEDFYRNTSAR